MDIVKNVADMQGFVLRAHRHDLKVVLENLVLRSLRVCKALCKLVNYFLWHTRSLPAEQVDISGDEIAGDEMIEVTSMLPFRSRILVSGWSGDVPHVEPASLFIGM